MNLKNSTKILSILFFTFSIALLFAQQTAPVTSSIEEGNLEDKFEYIKNISNSYNEGLDRYEVVNVKNLESLKAQVLDSIIDLKNQLDSASITINNQLKNIESLNKEVKKATSTVDQLNSQKDTISFFGQPINEVLYSLVVWSIILVLIVLLFVFIIKFKMRNTVFKEAKTKLADLELEYEEHRRRALEREQKVKRQLLDEINKHKKANN
jgi:preprotein translocase subunit SecG